ncbi:MAG: hypothetical protein IT282_11270 [Bacteroidetes bacterium]|nr:hypothetical protein [Bacteroidota bacterium]
MKPPQFRRSTIGWTSTDTVATLDEVDLPNQHQLLPGDSILLIVRSKALPTILRSWATGWTKPITGTEYDSLVELGFRPRKWYKDASENITIGPSSELFSTPALAFVDSLSYMAYRSRLVGWILSQSTADACSERFARVKNDLGQFALRSARSRIDSILQRANIDSSSTLTSEAYALIRFNTEYLRDKLKPTGEVKGGIFLPSSGTLSVKAKPSVDFGPADTARCIVATVRWPDTCNVSLGSVTGAYGFVKYDSVLTVGNHRYQKFRTSTPLAMNWSAGAEYELFTVSVSGSCGPETFELTNALPGGEWFVDINYLDKTDPVFY